jgi:hypothetical protein
VTQGLIIREHPVSVAGYPTAPLYENIGVQADIQSDYMTTSNLLHGGADYVNTFTAAILAMIGK